MVRKINNRLYKINTYASEMIVEVDDNYDEEVQKLKKEIQLDSLGCKLNLLVYLAELSVQGYAISSVTEFNSNGTKPRVAYANDKDFKKIVKYYSTKEAAEEEKTLFIGRHGNECIYVVRAVSREAAMHLLNEVTGFEGDAWDLDVADNENGKIIE